MQAPETQEVVLVLESNQVSRGKSGTFSKAGEKHLEHFKLVISN